MCYWRKKEKKKRGRLQKKKCASYTITPINAIVTTATSIIKHREYYGYTKEPVYNSLTFNPGGSDCLSLVALSPSVTLRVYKYLLQRTLNLV
eukprot:m.14431 g.14431  ORF g.14431 m.14431 type:complete len:92 (+) comp4311_c1_seq1:153-428(+)